MAKFIIYTISKPQMEETAAEQESQSLMSVFSILNTDAELFNIKDI